MDNFLTKVENYVKDTPNRVEHNLSKLWEDITHPAQTFQHAKDAIEKDPLKAIGGALLGGLPELVIEDKDKNK